MRSAVERLVQMLDSTALSAMFGKNVALIPVPRSAPLVAGGLWPAKVLCDEMVRQGLAAKVEPILERRKAVPKSAFARAGERPDLSKHLETMAITRWAEAERITLVDDVVTKGVTLFAGCALTIESNPNATVNAFGMVRTMGFLPDVQSVIEPVVGTLTLSGTSVHRNP